MDRFKNIIYVSTGIRDDVHGLMQAFKLAYENEAKIKILIVSPEFPRTLIGHKKKFGEMLVHQIKSAAETILSTMKSDVPPFSLIIKLEFSDSPATSIIQHVLRESHDLLVKEAETKEDQKGFKALDMNLLRKCPCPVWLCRPFKHTADKLQIAVAIDPESYEVEGHDLSIKLLQLSRSLADKNNEELIIISCWNFLFEDYFRHSARVRMEKEKLRKTSLQIQSEHRRALQTLICESGIKGGLQIHHLKGLPDKIIPDYIHNKKIDLLVMGTVARKGLSGFIIGNTAENILQSLDCTLLAIKPNGYISPVKAY